MRFEVMIGAFRFFLLALAVGAAAAAPRPALSMSIELKDAAPDRVERQRAAIDGRLPLPGTPDTDLLLQRLAVAGLRRGAPLLIRIFKAQSELEIWIENDGSYHHFATYPICYWSGTLGPKLREGDRQTPEGFYTLTLRQLHHMGRWPRSLNLGFPNAFDRSNGRGGSFILIHGGCSSIGCFAMTNPVIAEIYQLVAAAIHGGERHVPVHVFPFRMTDENVAAHADREWKDFWRDLKEGYDSFERTHRPPQIRVCDNRYQVEDARPVDARAPVTADSAPQGGSSESLPGAIETCGQTVVAAAETTPDPPAESVTRSKHRTHTGIRRHRHHRASARSHRRASR